MILTSGLLSAQRGAILVSAGAAFALGLTAGTAMGPLGAARTAAALPLPAVQTPALESRSRTAHPADVLRVLDGDTFEARVHVWPGLDITTKVRLRGIDAPELKAKCSGERAKAEASRTALSAILAEGAVEISRVGIDKYGGRVDADAATTSTPNVSAALLRAGAVRSYNGGRRQSWCGN
jgi:endonuclease YncB( thermonuclease family)